jgi:hypothetical protein
VRVASGATGERTVVSMLLPNYVSLPDLIAGLVMLTSRKTMPARYLADTII